MTTPPAKFAIPSVHLNGTSRSALMEGYAGATAAIRQAIKAVAETEPNSRDYYPQGAGALQVAQSQHLLRLAGLQAVLAELEVIIDNIAE